MLCSDGLSPAEPLDGNGDESTAPDRGEAARPTAQNRGLQFHGAAPEFLLVVDPIDGTGPAVAGLESSTVSVAVARMSDRPRIADVESLRSAPNRGATLYAPARRSRGRACRPDAAS
ncbi:Inositol monophosphatase family protein [Streptomyces sp. Ncost-T10-10d]|nr:Inositol monophosphatase family protein [Streptomyces sp. Ncost-T10-10d]